MERIVKAINQGWKFSLGESIGADSDTVSLPHSVTLSPAISSGGRNYQGKCCYQKDLFIPDEFSQKKLLLEFEGAMGVTELHLNGRLVKTHTCGYTPLIADITEFVVYGENNSLFLLLDNSDNEDVPPGKAQDDLDFTYEGGLYRVARLIVTDRLYITNEILADKVAGGGIFVSYSGISEKSATVHTKVNVKNETGENKDFILKLSLRGNSGKFEVFTDIKASLLSGCDCELEADLLVNAPSLWSPEAPNLYTLSAIVEADGVCDTVVTKIGIRSFEMTPDGLIFNGKKRRLAGGNYHQTYPYIGNGVPESLLKRDALKLRELGMESIRSHYPFATAFSDACAELGMTLIISNPGWQWFKEGIFAERALKNLRDIVRWQRNNPAVVLWEPILNETAMPDWFQQKAHDIVHEEYPYTSCYTASDHGPTDISYREYDPGMLAPGMEGYNAEKRYGAVADMPLWIREYNDSPDNWSDQSCAWRVPRGFGDYPMLRSVERMLGLDPQCTTNNYVNIYNRKNLCGYNIWPAIEHNRGYHINPCWGGHFDLFRVEKFSYYFDKSQRDISDCGVVLFIANWWTEMSPDDVTVFSNAQKVRLYHDDVLVGEEAPQDIPVNHPPFVFSKVHSRFKQRERSVLRAEALQDGNVVAVTTVQSPGVPCRLKLEADFMSVPLHADGSDIVMVYCKMLDLEGNVVPMTGDRHPILFSVSGEGEIVGDHTIGANPICAEAGIAAVLVRSTAKCGEIKVKAEMLWKQSNQRAAIKPDEICFKSLEYTE